MKFRSLNIDDYDRLMALWLRAGLSIRPNGRDSRESIADEMLNNPDGFIGLFDANRLIGFALATYDGRKGWINRVAVDPDYRRQGLGGMLIEESERRLKKRGAHITTCLIEEWNEASLALVQKMGYILHRDILYLSKRDSPDV